MGNRKTLARAALVAVFLWAAPAQAQSPFLCMPHKEMVNYLGEKHGERLVIAGMIGQVAFFEIFAAPDGVWTTVVTSVKDSIACLIGAGTRLRAVPRAPEGEPS